VCVCMHTYKKSLDVNPILEAIIILTSLHKEHNMQVWRCVSRWADSFTLENEGAMHL